MKKIVLLIPFLLLILPILVLAQGLPNPASAYCIEQGYKNEIRAMEDSPDQFGVCVFEDSECEEWKYFRGECKARDCQGKITGYFECKEGCEKTEPECCTAKFVCKPKSFMERFQEWIKYIFIWLWFEEEEKEKKYF